MALVRYLQRNVSPAALRNCAHALGMLSIALAGALGQARLSATRAERVSRERTLALDQHRAASERLASAQWARLSLALSAQPGRVLEALTAALEAIRPDIIRHRDPGSDVVRALIAATEAGREALPLSSAAGPVDTVRFSPDGARVLVTHRGGAARAWDAYSGRSLASLESGFSDPYAASVFSPDGALLLTTGGYGGVLYRDVSSGRVLWSLPGHDEPPRPWSRAGFTADGARASVHEGELGETEVERLWDPTTGRVVATLHGPLGYLFFLPGRRNFVTVLGDVALRNISTGAVVGSVPLRATNPSFVQLSPSGERLALIDQNGVQVWDLRRRLPGVAFHEPSGDRTQNTDGQSVESVTALDFAPDTSEVSSLNADLLVGGSWGTVTRWRLTLTPTPRPSLYVGPTSRVNSVGYSSDGMWIVATSDDGSTWVWGLAETRPRRAFRGHDGGATSAAFSPGGTLVATGGVDGTVWLWNQHREQATRTIYTGSYARQTSLSTDGTRLVLAGGLQAGGRVGSQVWDLSSGSLVVDFPSGDPAHVETTAIFSPDDTRILTGDTAGTARIRDPRTGDVLLSFRAHEGPMRGAVFSSDGAHVLTAGNDGVVRVWNARTGQRAMDFSVEHHAALAMWLSPDGVRLMVVYSDGRTRVLDTRTRQVRASPAGTNGGATHAAISVDGVHVAILDGSASVYLWNSGTGAVRVLRGHSRQVVTLEFSANSDLLVTASRDHHARVWDLRTGGSRADLDGHTDELVTAGFNRAGTRVVTGGSDNTAQVWDAMTGERLEVLRGHASPVVFARFVPDGGRVVTADMNRFVKVFEVATRSRVAAACSMLRYRSGYDRVRDVCESPTARR